MPAAVFPSDGFVFPAQGYCGEETTGVFSNTGREIASVSAVFFSSGGYIVFRHKAIAGRKLCFFFPHG